MMKRMICGFFCILLVLTLTACGFSNKKAHIGVSFGVGSAVRWVHEKEYMEEKAKELGIDLEARLNTTDQPKTQQQDCEEMIDNGIDVLIIVPRDATKVDPIIEYAKKKGVKVVSYARVIKNTKVDLFVGYDSSKIGQTLGQYLSEIVDHGDYIILRGDPNDNNATLLYEGSMRFIEPIKQDIHILLDEAVAGWSPDVAKQMVYDAVKANNNHVDAILAPNDALAGACAEALDELGVDEPVVITGMDAELTAAQRIVNNQQDVTISMDLKELADTAVTEAYHLATKQKVMVNSEFDIGGGKAINANLITGKLVTKANLDKILIDSGYFTHEEVYGE